MCISLGILKSTLYVQDIYVVKIIPVSNSLGFGQCQMLFLTFFSFVLTSCFIIIITRVLLPSCVPFHFPYLPECIGVFSPQCLSQHLRVRVPDKAWVPLPCGFCTSWTVSTTLLKGVFWVNSPVFLRPMLHDRVRVIRWLVSDSLWTESPS